MSLLLQRIKQWQEKTTGPETLKHKPGGKDHNQKRHGWRFSEDGWKRPFDNPDEAAAYNKARTHRQSEEKIKKASVEQLRKWRADSVDQQKAGVPGAGKMIARWDREIKKRAGANPTPAAAKPAAPARGRLNELGAGQAWPKVTAAYGKPVDSAGVSVVNGKRYGWYKSGDRYSYDKGLTWDREQRVAFRMAKGA